MGESSGQFVHGLTQFADDHFPHSCSHSLDFHICNRYGFNRSNSRHKASMPFSTSSAEPLRCSDEERQPLARGKAALTPE
jgi:hypothetical protein